MLSLMPSQRRLPEGIVVPLPLVFDEMLQAYITAHLKPGIVLV